MQLQFSFKHMETSVALQEFAEKKVTEKIQKFVTKAIEAHLIFSVERHNQTAKCLLTGGDGFNLEVEHTSDDMYASVDQLCSKLHAQLKKHKEKLKNHKGTHLGRDPNFQLEVEDTEEAVDAGDIIKLEEAKSSH